MDARPPTARLLPSLLRSVFDSLRDELGLVGSQTPPRTDTSRCPCEEGPRRACGFVYSADNKGQRDFCFSQDVRARQHKRLKFPLISITTRKELWFYFPDSLLLLLWLRKKSRSVAVIHVRPSRPSLLGICILHQNHFSSTSVPAGRFTSWAPELRSGFGTCAGQGQEVSRGPSPPSLPWSGGICGYNGTPGCRASSGGRRPWRCAAGFAAARNKLVLRH